MKCIKVKEKLYLYNEITPAERQEVDAHLKICNSCQRVAGQLRAANKAVSLHRMNVPQIANQAHMVQRIMGRIETLENTSSTFSWFKFGDRLSVGPLRYALAVLSIFLVTFFLGEYSQSVNDSYVIKHTRVPLGQKTELNLASFHNAFFTLRDKRDPSGLFSTCVSSCLQMDESDCEACSKMYSKN